jgi:hypothetical protein
MYHSHFRLVLDEFLEIKSGWDNQRTTLLCVQTTYKLNIVPVKDSFNIENNFLRRTELICLIGSSCIFPFLFAFCSENLESNFCLKMVIQPRHVTV